MMLITLAWRNIWRNRTRSLVIIGAILIGVWALIFLLSFIHGMMSSYINNTIEHEISHLQIHHPEFQKDYEIEYFFDGISEKLGAIQSTENIHAATARTLVNGMMTSPKGISRGVQVRGILPTDEAAVTKIDTKIIEGKYLSDEKRNPILVGKKLAEKLKIKERSKVVLQFQDLENEIVSMAFRVMGIFETNNNRFDEFNVLVLQKDLNPKLGIGAGAHEIAVFLKEEKDISKDSTALQSIAPNLLVETYEQLAPDVKLFRTQIKVSSTFITVIIMLALVFGIINTMLMVVLERYRELGMLMAVGMNKFRVFALIMLETIFLGVVSAPIGMLMGYLTVLWTSKRGIDLSAYSSGLSEFGMSSMVYTSLQSELFFQMALAVLITTILGAIYPAIKAVRLKPVEAIRKI